MYSSIDLTWMNNKRRLIRCVCSGIALFAATAAHATCLSIEYHNGHGWWINHCNRAVFVNWNDTVNCGNWNCSDQLGPYGRDSAGPNGRVSWCEFYDGRGGKGPC
jgi:hypothetical protein